jgi:hypothetical protein
MIIPIIPPMSKITPSASNEITKYKTKGSAQVAFAAIQDATFGNGNTHWRSASEQLHASASVEYNDENEKNINRNFLIISILLYVVSPSPWQRRNER